MRFEDYIGESCCVGWIALLYLSYRRYGMQWERARGLLQKALPIGRTGSASKYLGREGGVGERREKQKKAGYKETVSNHNDCK